MRSVMLPDKPLAIEPTRKSPIPTSSHGFRP
jgi:hypothetical protein